MAKGSPRQPVGGAEHAVKIRAVAILGPACWATGLLLAEVPVPVPEANTVTWEPLYQGIDLARLRVGDPEARLVGAALRIDLRTEGLHFQGTPDNGEAPRETNGATVSGFLLQSKARLALNTCFFDPLGPTPGDPKNLVGLAVVDGGLVSPWDPVMPRALAITGKNQALILREAPRDISNLKFAAAGLPLLHEGNPEHQPGGALHPRTAAGISRDGNFLYLLVIEGRLPRQRLGATLEETARWMKALGSHHALNLDGGGSSVLVQSDPETPEGFVRLTKLPETGNASWAATLRFSRRN